jgi:hypothetical protein
MGARFRSVQLAMIWVVASADTRTKALCASALALMRSGMAPQTQLSAHSPLPSARGQ